MLPVFLVALNLAGIMSGKEILKGWRVAVLVATVFAGLATPAADVVSMLMLAGILVVLFFAAAGLSMLFDRRKAKRDAAILPPEAHRVTEPGPAERYERAREAAQQDRSHPLTAAFAASQRFTLDPFQLAGCRALEEGRSVLVAAPDRRRQDDRRRVRGPPRDARAAGDKAFYTTPIKALSNQKFRELQDVYGADEVGLLTGDTNINGNARIVVMTTEVLRNMLYADSPALRGLRYVVMDEVHYLADRFRGAVWEEIIIHLPQSVRLVSLSATVSNAEEFGDWLDTVRGDTEVIVSEIRPVPLEQHVLVRGDLLPLFDDRAGIATAQVNQELMRIRSFKGPMYESNRRAQADEQRPQRAGTRQPHRRPNKGGKRPVRSANVQRIERLDRPDVVELLARANLLPAIFFIFSRVGCDAAVQQVRRAGVRLTSHEERTRDPRDRRGAHAHPARRGPRGARLLGLARQPRARRRRRTTPACCRRSRRSSRSSSSASS